MNKTGSRSPPHALDGIFLASRFGLANIPLAAFQDS
jgi:hypothetical protein